VYSSFYGHWTFQADIFQTIGLPYIFSSTAESVSRDLSTTVCLALLTVSMARIAILLSFTAIMQARKPYGGRARTQKSVFQHRLNECVAIVNVQSRIDREAGNVDTETYHRWPVRRTNGPTLYFPTIPFHIRSSLSAIIH